MKDKSLILKKATRRRRTSPTHDLFKSEAVVEEETWSDMRWSNGIDPVHLIKLLEHLTNKLGVKVEISSNGNIRFSDHLTEEQEQALLGD